MSNDTKIAYHSLVTHSQGTKFLTRFDAVTYVKLTEQMDTHDIGRGREGGVVGTLSRLRTPLLIMGISSDLLYPLEEQQRIARAVPGAIFRTIQSSAGHDGFLLEQDQVASGVATLLASIDTHC